VLRRKFGSKRDEVRGSGENYIMRRLEIYTTHRILFGMGVACNTFGGEERRIQGFGGKT